jgi:hypothetical protein
MARVTWHIRHDLGQMPAASLARWIFVWRIVQKSGPAFPRRTMRRSKTKP